MPPKWSGASHLCAGNRVLATPVRSRPVRDGSVHEARLYLALSSEWVEMRPGSSGGEWLRQYPFGAFLSPTRRFTFDAAFPRAMLGVEVEGKAHDMKRKGDVLRRQLAEGAGWRVLSVLPEQVRDGSAIALIREAVSHKSNQARGAGGEG